MNSTLVCPLISVSDPENSRMCLEENCAWYMKSYKACSVYVQAYNAAMDIKKKQQG